MARMDFRQERPRRKFPLRLIITLMAILGLLLTGGFLVFVPLRQLYWGAYARLKPFHPAADEFTRDTNIPGAQLRH